MTAADLRRIQSYLRVAAPRWRDHEQIGPFLATFTADTDNPYLNYAIPDDGAKPLPAEVDALVAAYRARERKPRLEYIPKVAPAVEPALIDAGFEIEGRLPLMIHRRRDDPSATDPVGIELLLPESDDELRGVATVQWEAYEEEGPVPERAVTALHRTIDAGGTVVLARDAATQEPAGAGVCTAPHAGITELTSIGVRAPFRRRGIAEAMTRWLARRMRRSGVDRIFLMADTDRIARIYERAGFRTISEVLCVVRNA
ncbi:MAG TPA: GNAT family N-acetyltransferase [Gaiellaceae bacterium]|jgi:ribosomal protein S18 acetylase RimI-like enzyme|nr:GNAT family N-acetyltransferase [Gaiellaceae bacterium]